MAKREKKIFESDTWIVKYNEEDESFTIDLLYEGEKQGRQVYVDETVFGELEETSE